PSRQLHEVRLDSADLEFFLVAVDRWVDAERATHLAEGTDGSVIEWPIECATARESPYWAAICFDTLSAGSVTTAPGPTARGTRVDSPAGHHRFQLRSPDRHGTRWQVPDP